MGLHSRIKNTALYAGHGLIHLAVSHELTMQLAHCYSSQIAVPSDEGLHWSNFWGVAKWSDSLLNPPFLISSPSSSL